MSERSEDILQQLEHRLGISVGSTNDVFEDELSKAQREDLEREWAATDAVAWLDVSSFSPVHTYSLPPSCCVCMCVCRCPFAN